MEFLEAKTLLRKVSYGDLWFGIDYVMNLYKGCNHRCIYCDSRSDKYFIEDFDRVRGKKNTADILHFELRKNKNGVINFGAMSDAYNGEELRHFITQAALKKIFEFGYGISIETKSNQIVRDKELIKQIQDRFSACIKLSITTADDQLARKIEPGICVSSKRFKAIEELRKEGIYAGVLMTPVLPYITDSKENIISMVKMAYKSGASFIYASFGMTLRDSQKAHYYQMLAKDFPDVLPKYIQRYQEKYSCPVPDYIQCTELFKEQCEKYGLMYKMTDIIDACPKKNQLQQLSLF